MTGRIKQQMCLNCGGDFNGPDGAVHCKRCGKNWQANEMNNIVRLESKGAQDARTFKSIRGVVRATMAQIDALNPMPDWEMVKFGMLEAINAGVDARTIKKVAIDAESAFDLRETLLALTWAENDKRDDDYAG